MQSAGLQDPGRRIERAPEHVAQLVLSIVRPAGAAGVGLDELQRRMPAHSGEEIGGALDDLMRRQLVEPAGSEADVAPVRVRACD